jgi:hypothetical protein
MRHEKLSAALLADRERETPRHNIVSCFVCGHTFVYRGRRADVNGRFCSLRCQAWYDADYEPIADEIIYRWRDGRPILKTSDGFRINCAYCGKEFESLGLRCCSSECEHAYCDREHNLAIMAEAGIEPSPKRLCESCSAVIPKWRNGRRVSKSVRFCSEKCSKRARRAAA